MPTKSGFPPRNRSRICPQWQKSQNFWYQCILSYSLWVSMGGDAPEEWQTETISFYYQWGMQLQKNMVLICHPAGAWNYITINRDSTLQTNACSYMRVKQQTVKNKNRLKHCLLSQSRLVTSNERSMNVGCQQGALGPAALGLGRGLQPRVMSNPDTNQGLYFYYITIFSLKTYLRN